jgi:glutamine cyclotransferase
MKRSKQPDSPAAGIALRRRRWPRRWAVGLLAGAAALAGIAWGLARGAEPVVFDFEIVNTYPHDSEAYCQGLAFDGGVLFEGTGEYGKSSLRKVQLETGQVLQQINLGARYFGEGIAVGKDRIFQLTWTNEVGFVYDKESFQQRTQFRYGGEGWGLTHDGQYLILSDGSPTLRYLDPQTFQVVRRLSVRSQGRRIRDLNELEYVDGQIFANVWHQDHIVCISPRSGEVVAWINLKGLYPADQRAHPEAVLNGIAYDAHAKRLFVTGKNWPKLFEIRLKRREG